MALGEKIGPALLSMLPVFPILVPLAGHFILVNFAMLATLVIDGNLDGSLINWLPLTYMFSNIIFFMVGIWSLQDKENILPVAMFIFVVVVTALNDIIMLGLMFGNARKNWGGGDNSFERTWQFSAAMMIINLLAKPFTVALSVLSIFFRAGGSIPGLNPAAAAYQPVQGN